MCYQYADMVVREEIKSYSAWPTIPQVRGLKEWEPVNISLLTDQLTTHPHRHRHFIPLAVLHCR